MNIEAAGIILQETPIENPGSIGIVEIFHAPLRISFNKLIESLPKGDLNDADCLKRETYTTISTVGTDVLCQKILVFGTILRPTKTVPTTNQLERKK